MRLGVVVLAGGRISGWFARASDTRIKALVPLSGKLLLRRVLDAVADRKRFGPVCVVGPEDLRPHLHADEVWVPEEGRVLKNLLAGLRTLEATEPSARVLVAAADSGAMTADAATDFLSRAPADAEICMPLVFKERFQAAFPGNLGIYVRLADGRFTSGGQLLVKPDAIARNEALLQAMFDRRKSQLAMAGALGGRFLGRLITGRLSISELEERAQILTGCRCRAVMDCAPQLAFDVDSWLDARYLQQWIASQKPE